MKTILIILGVIVVIAIGYMFFANADPVTDRVTTTSTTTTSTTQTQEETNTFPVAVRPIEHASAVLEWGGQTVYVDPVGGEAQFAAYGSPDVVLITDIHGDHLSTSTLASIVASSTQIVAPQAVADMLEEDMLTQTVVLDNGATTTIQGFSIEAVPMYNLPETDDSYHEKGRGNGYVLERDATRVYIAGDTSNTPELQAVENIDIALMPMNLPFTMSVEDAAEATIALAPRVVYPYHYRGEDGLSDVSRFRQLVNADDANIEVVLLDWYPNE